MPVSGLKKTYYRGQMKKSILMIILTAVFFVPAIAAEKVISLEGFHPGVKLGGNYPLSAVVGDELGLIATMPNVGFSGGFMFQYVFKGNWFALQGELNYFNMGYTVDDVMYFDSTGDSMGLATYSETQHYIQIPLLVKFSLPSESPARPFFVLGPGIDIRFMDDSKIGGTSYISTELGYRIILATGIGGDWVFTS